MALSNAQPLHGKAIPVLNGKTRVKIEFRRPFLTVPLPRSDFNNVSLPMDVTFLVTVSVGGQLNRENLNATFRTGVINSPPSAQQCSITMLEDTVTVIQLQGTDPDSGDVVQMYVLSAPENGQLYQFSPTALNSKGQPIDPSLSPIPVSDSLGRVVYIPQAEYNGNDTFIFLARDQYLTGSSFYRTLDIDYLY